MKRFEKSFEYIPGECSGESLERELLGTVKDPEKIEGERRLVSNLMEQLKISRLDAAMLRVKELHKDNPINPKSPFANSTRQRVVDFLDLEDENKEKNLKFYTTVSKSNNKTVLDRDFGIDAFVELEQENKKEPIIITIDLTLKPYKQNPKADIIFSLPDDFPIHVRFNKKGKRVGLSESEEKTFIKYTEDLARQIAEKIKKDL